MRLALKFTLWCTLGVLLVSGVAATLRVQREIALFDGQIRRDHEAIGADLAVAIEEVWRFAGEGEAMAFVTRIDETKGDVAIRWVWPNVTEDAPVDRPIARDRMDGLERSADVVHARVDLDGRIQDCTYVAVLTPAERLGALELCESRDEVRAYVRTTIIRTVVVTMVTVVLCGILMIALGALIVGRPVRLLSESARRIAAGDLSARFDINQRDELGALAGQLNAMSDQLASAEHRIGVEASSHRNTTEQLRHAQRLTTAGTLASGIAHELGTPINIILARAGMIAEGGCDDERVGAYAQIIAEEARRMSGAIRQLLNLVRRQAPTKAPTDLRHVIQRVTELLNPAATNAAVNVKADLPEQPVIALVDAGQMSQVLSNLVLNGIQAMPKGGNLTIGIRADSLAPAIQGGQERQALCAYVQDEGCGISPDDLEHMFEPFFTTKGATGGTGLGLSVAADIVDEHGGRIDVRSELGRGTCFFIYLPMEAAPCQAVS